MQQLQLEIPVVEHFHPSDWFLGEEYYFIDIWPLLHKANCDALLRRDPPDLADSTFICGFTESRSMTEVKHSPEFREAALLVANVCAGEAVFATGPLGSVLLQQHREITIRLNIQHRPAKRPAPGSGEGWYDKCTLNDIIAADISQEIAVALWEGNEVDYRFAEAMRNRLTHREEHWAPELSTISDYTIPLLEDENAYGLGPFGKFAGSRLIELIQRAIPLVTTDPKKRDYYYHAVEYSNGCLASCFKINGKFRYNVAAYKYLRTMFNDKELAKEVNGAQLVGKWLTREERRQLSQFGCVVVQSKKHPERQYIIPEDPESRVGLVEDGIVKTMLCGIITVSDREGNRFVMGDKFLTKVMALKENEDYYCKTAIPSSSGGTAVNMILNCSAGDNNDKKVFRFAKKLGWPLKLVR